METWCSTAAFGPVWKQRRACVNRTRLSQNHQRLHATAKITCKQKRSHLLMLQAKRDRERSHNPAVSFHVSDTLWGVKLRRDRSGSTINQSLQKSAPDSSDYFKETQRLKFKLHQTSRHTIVQSSRGGSIWHVYAIVFTETHVGRKLKYILNKIKIQSCWHMLAGYISHLHVPMLLLSSYTVANTS